MTDTVKNKLQKKGIPLSGTTIGNPVTGDIFLDDGVAIVPQEGGGSFYLGNILLGCISIGADGNLILRSFDASFKGLDGESDFSANLTDLAYPQKIYVDNRGAVSNSTTTGLTASNLNTTYPDAKDGFRVFAKDIIAGGLIYHKSGSSWFSQPITLVI